MLVSGREFDLQVFVVYVKCSCTYIYYRYVCIYSVSRRNLNLCP